MTLRTLLSIGAISALLLAVACGDDDDDPRTGPDEVNLRVAHTALAAPAVDVYVQGVDAPLFQSVAYGEVTDFLRTDPATVVVEVRATGADPASDPAFTSGELTLPDGATITVLAAGVLGSTDPVDAFRLIPVVEDFAPVDPGTIRARIIHTAVDAPTVAIDVGVDGTSEIPELPLFGDTGADGVALPADEAIRIGVRLTADDGGALVTAFTTPALPSGLELIAVATGFLAEHPREVDSFSILAIAPDGAAGLIAQDPTVQVLHAAPDVAAVDLASGGLPIASNLRFAEITDAIQLPPGRYDIDILPAGSSDVLTTVTTPALAAGQRYLATAAGFLNAAEGEGAFSVEYLVDGIESEGDAAAVQLVHYAPDVPPVDVGVVDGDMFTALFEDFGYTDATDPMGVMLPAATTEVGLALAGTGTPAVRFDVTADSGQTAFGLVAGALGATEDREPLRLIVVDTTAGLPWVVGEIFPN